MEELLGSIEHLTYYNEESHFTVARIRADGKAVCVVGVMPAIQVGERVRCRGTWQRHSKHGEQFSVESYDLELPTTPADIERFLGSKVVKGVGPQMAKQIVALFGDKTLHILNNSPDSLAAIPGLKLGGKRLALIKQSWHEHTASQEIFLAFHSFGVSRAYAKRIIKTYGQYALQMIKRNPYQLAKDVDGIGFHVADNIAKHFGFAAEFPGRVDAGIDYTLFDLAEDGHVCCPRGELIKRSAAMLQVGEPLVAERLDALAEEQAVIQQTNDETPYVWAPPLFASERGIANEVRRLLAARPATRQFATDKAVSWAEETLKLQFAPEQSAAVLQTLERPFSIITGGPGTGKSTITRGIITIMAKLTPRILLTAPTGRAAKRLTEITRCPAVTIHRLLGMGDEGFVHNRRNPLEGDLLIVDEASMIDTHLMYQLLQAIPSGCRVVLVGDANQLPSVGPGNVLRDLIASQTVPCTELLAIFRQAAGSCIVVSAHSINAGTMPSTYNTPDSDFYFVDAQEPEQVCSIIVELATQRVPKKFGYDPRRDIQVLAPMHKGGCGIEALNSRLQACMTPDATIHLNGFRLYDKVMQLRNDYDKGVFNGDVGIVSAIDAEEGTLMVQVDDLQIPYTASELNSLVLAYAISIHKYQGSECPCIIMPVHTAHYKMLTRNLLYTGVTRGKKLVILVGTKKALAIAVQNKDVSLRHTGLRWALTNGSGKSSLREAQVSA